MAGCSSQTFTDVTPAVWDCLVSKAESSFGISISGPSGSASKSGVTVRWDWSSADGTLTMQCTDKPFLIACGMIESAINSAVTGCGGTAS